MTVSQLPDFVIERVKLAIDAQDSGEVMRQLDKTHPVTVVNFDPVIVSNNGNYFLIDEDGDLHPVAIELRN